MPTSPTISAWKGRDFLGLTAAFFFLALIVGLMMNMATLGTEGRVAAQTGMTLGVASLANTIAHGALAFAVVYVPGFIFVALAKPAKRDD